MPKIRCLKQTKTPPRTHDTHMLCISNFLHRFDLASQTRDVVSLACFSFFQSSLKKWNPVRRPAPSAQANRSLTLIEDTNPAGFVLASKALLIVLPATVNEECANLRATVMIDARPAGRCARRISMSLARESIALDPSVVGN